MKQAICTLAFFVVFCLSEILVITTNFDQEQHPAVGDNVVHCRQNTSLLKVHLNA